MALTATFVGLAVIGIIGLIVIRGWLHDARPNKLAPAGLSSGAVQLADSHTVTPSASLGATVTGSRNAPASLPIELAPTSPATAASLEKQPISPAASGRNVALLNAKEHQLAKIKPAPSRGSDPKDRPEANQKSIPATNTKSGSTSDLLDGRR